MSTVKVGAETSSVHIQGSRDEFQRVELFNIWGFITRSFTIHGMTIGKPLQGWYIPFKWEPMFLGMNSVSILFNHRSSLKKRIHFPWVFDGPKACGDSENHFFSFCKRQPKSQFREALDSLDIFF